MLPSDLEPALSFCTHLCYKSAIIQPDTYKVVPLNENLDVDRAHDNYRAITNLKRQHPQLKTLLTVGGDDDIDDTQKYNHVVSNMRFIIMIYIFFHS